MKRLGYALFLGITLALLLGLSLPAVAAYDYDSVYNCNTGTWYTYLNDAVTAANDGDTLQLGKRDYSGNLVNLVKVYGTEIVIDKALTFVADDDRSDEFELDWPTLSGNYIYVANGGHLTVKQKGTREEWYTVVQFFCEVVVQDGGSLDIDANMRDTKFTVCNGGRASIRGTTVESNIKFGSYGTIYVEAGGVIDELYNVQFANYSSISYGYGLLNEGTIHRIEGGTFEGKVAGIYNAAGGVIDEIKDVTVTCNRSLNDRYYDNTAGMVNLGTIHHIDGGTFVCTYTYSSGTRYNDYGIYNAGLINNLENATCVGIYGIFVGNTEHWRSSGSGLIANTPGGTINVLTNVRAKGTSVGMKVLEGATVETIDGSESLFIGGFCGINLYSGVIREIKNGTFWGGDVGLLIGCGGGLHMIDAEHDFHDPICTTITGGTFCGAKKFGLACSTDINSKFKQAVRCTLEPELAVDVDIGSTRFYGGESPIYNGQFAFLDIGDNEDIYGCKPAVEYPANHHLMSTDTEERVVATDLIQDDSGGWTVTTETVATHYLTYGYLVTYDRNDDDYNYTYLNSYEQIQSDPNPYLPSSTVTVKSNDELRYVVLNQFILDGWNTAADGSGTTYAPGDTFQITDDTTLYAQWTDRYFTITYDANGGEGTMIDPLAPYAYKDTVTLLPNAFTRPGYTFSYWSGRSEDADLYEEGWSLKYSPGYTFQILHDVFAYAHWEKTEATDSNNNPGGDSDGSDTEYTDFDDENAVVSTGTVTVPDETGVSDLLNTTDHLAYLVGVGDLFAPDREMTRAEVAVMFYRLLRDQNVPLTRTFSDVPDGQWYTTAVQTLASLGVLQGYGDGAFGPGDPVTRAQFTAIAMRFGTLDATGENLFSDVSEGDWFYPYVVGAIQSGWITGYPDGTFRPNATIARAEVVAITNRMLGRAADQAYVAAHGDSLTQFADVPADHWAYDPIMEATNSHDYTRTDGEERWSTPVSQ